MALPRPSCRSITVGLLWHSLNSSNYGVGALTASHIRLFDEIARELDCQISFELAGWDDPVPAYVAHPNLIAHPFSRKFMMSYSRGLAAMASRCQVVFDIGAGDSFTDQYGVKRFWLQTGSKAVVLAIGTPLVLAPQTIGPFSRPWTRRLAALVMRRCRTVVCRDEISADFVRALDPAITMVETTDVAFMLPFRPVDRARSGKVLVGLNVSGLLFNDSVDRRNAFGLGVDYAALVRGLIRRFTARSEVEVHLFSHVVVPRRFEGIAEDDHRIAQRLGEEFDGLVVEPAFGSPEEAKSHIATMDFFCGSRMHACVAAFSAGVPTVPIAYSRKFLGLFRTLGYPHVADAVTDDFGTILDKVSEGFDNREQLRVEVCDANREAMRRIEAYRLVIRECLLGILDSSLVTAALPTAEIRSTTPACGSR